MPGRGSGRSSTPSVIGIVALLVCLAIDYRMLAEHSLFFYGGLLVLLLFVLFNGVDADGRRSAGFRSARSTCSRRSSAASRSR